MVCRVILSPLWRTLRKRLTDLDNIFARTPSLLPGCMSSDVCAVFLAEARARPHRTCISRLTKLKKLLYVDSGGMCDVKSRFYKDPPFIKHKHPKHPHRPPA